MKPSVSFAYLSVILLWATTPLTIVWSSQTVHPTFAVLSRMLIAALIGLIVIQCFRIQFPWSKRALSLYCFSALGIFGGMSLAYLASRSIPSGTMSLVFGLSPLVSGILSQRILAEPPFSLIKKAALVLSTIGLAVVVKDNLSINKDSISGLLAILVAMIFFSVSAVLVKTVDIKINAVATTTGALLVTLPLFFIVWLVFDGELPYEDWSTRSVLAILYLGVFGSFLGFIAYYFVLQHLSATTVSLITLVTPVLAMSLGAWLNNESISTTLLIGALLVVIGLAVYLFGDKAFSNLNERKIKRRCTG